MGLRLKNSSGNYVELNAPSSIATDFGLTLPVNDGDSGQYLQTNGTGTLGWQTVADTSTSVAVLTDVKTQNTPGGTFTSGAWRTRDLNTEPYDPDGIVTLSSNQFTLGAGTYLIHWDCPAFYVQRHQSRLYDVTGAAEVEKGTSNYTNNGAENVQNSSPGAAVVSPTANNVYEIQHRCQTTCSTNGFGIESNFGTERYTRVTIWKVA